MIEKLTMLFSNAWELSALFGGFIIGAAVSVFLHEYGHYLAVMCYKGKPRFGYYGKGIKTSFFVTSAYGDDFYWNLYNRDRSNAWKKQIIISGSGLLASFFVAAILFWVSLFTANMDVPFVLCVLSGVLSFYNFALFLACLCSSSPSSDGYKVRRAFKCRQAFVDHFEEIGYQFTPDHLKLEIVRFQKE